MNRAGLLVAAVLIIASAPTRAQTLQAALGLAYRSNPTLAGQRATQRGIDETEVQARTGWRPVVTATLDSGYQRAPYSPYDFGSGSFEANDGEAVLTVRQPVYTGGRVANAVRAAAARVLAGQQGLRMVEAQVFQSVILAYMDVLRDQDILSVRRADLATLQRQVRETNSRFALGARLTRTDVAQAEAQRQQAVVSLASAEAQLDASRANYRAAVGVPPGVLVQPASLPGLPETLEAGLRQAEAANPGLAESRLTATASGDDVATARSAYFPTVAVEGSIGAIGPVAPWRGSSYDREASGLVTLTVPLVTGGLVASQVRAAEDRREADRQSANSAGRQAVQGVATAWSQMRAGLVGIAASEAQVQAAAMALRGYQLEYGYGLRNTLDVLIADENLRAAQVSLAQSRHDTIVAEASLLAATGRLEARQLLPDEPLYDPRAALRRVRQAGAVPWEGAIARLDRGG